MKITMRRFPTWAIWALTLLPHASSTAAGPPYPRVPIKWEDLMVAISEFPRFFGEPPKIGRTDPPKVDSFVDGDPENPGVVKLFTKEKNGLKYYIDGPLGVAETLRRFGKAQLHASFHLQRADLPDLKGLHFRAMKDVKCVDDGGRELCQASFLQTFPYTEIEIENARVVVKWENFDGGLVGNNHIEYLAYTGEPEHSGWPREGPRDGRICTQWEARDSAALRAMKQPDWEPLDPWRDDDIGEIVYTVQDGRLFLAWRITFNLKDDVGDDFQVYVDARDCKHIISASSASMTTPVRTRDEFIQQSMHLFQDRGLPVFRNVSSYPSHHAL